MHIFKGVFLTTSTFALAAAAIPPAGAQTTDTGGLALEEVVITAQKREETLQKAALSIAALDGDDVREQGKTDLANILRGVAGVETGNGFFFVRGVGSAPQFGQDASVTVSVNGVFLQNAQTQRDTFFDIARIEVARGPQTTLTGRTSEGGAVNVITNEPNLDKVEVKGVVEGGDHSRFSQQGVVNLPLGSMFALRTAFSTVKKDGFYTSGGDVDTSAGRIRLLFEPSDNVKLIISGERSVGKLTGTAGGASGRIDLTQPFYTLNGNYWNPTPPLSINRYTITNLFADFTWKTGIGTLYFQPTYQKNRVVAYPGYNTNPVNLFNNLALGYNYDAAVARSTTSNSSSSPADSKSAELRFSNPDDSTLKWLVGAYYYRGTQAIALLSGSAAGTSVPNNSTANAANATAVGVLPDIGYPIVYPQSNRRVTIDKDLYFQATYPITPAWRVTGGARYSNDSKERGNAIGGYVVDGSAINTNFRFPLDNFAASTSLNGPFVYYNLSAATASYKHTNWLTKLEHDFTPDSMAYAMVSTGWKTGSFINIPTPGDICSPPPAGAPQAGSCASNVALVTPGFKAAYDPEYLTAYEIGSKNTLLDQRMRINGSLYYYNYKGFQFNYAVNWINPATGVDPDFQPLTGQTGNAKKAVSYGGELETSFLLTEHDKLDLNVSYIHARLKKVEVSSLAAASVKTWAASLTDFTFPHAPTWQVRPQYSHVFDFVGGSNIEASVDAQYSSKQYTQLPANCQQIPGTYAAGACTTAALTVDDHVLSYYVQPAFTKVNFSLGYHSSNNKWGVTAFVTNATNKKTIVTFNPPNSFTGTSSIGSAGFTPDDPRTWGVIVNGGF